MFIFVFVYHILVFLQRQKLFAPVLIKRIKINNFKTIFIFINYYLHNFYGIVYIKRKKCFALVKK